MSQINTVLSTLKQALRQQGKTYSEVAAVLDLSESSVKRLFSSGQISLARLEQIAQLVGLELTDLIKLAQQNLKRINQLSLQQEQQLVTEPKLLIVATCALNHWRFEDILDHYDFTASECIEKLIRLTELDIIDLLPANVIKLKVSSDFSWLPNGPIQQFFQQHLQTDFMQSHFDKPQELFLCLNGMLSPQDNAQLQKQLRALAATFTKLNQRSATLPINETQGSALVVALRPWLPKIFEQYIKS
ncbi:MAG: helix-turn-helix transcriptional regulator [Coxiellaceae bacterium]|nr:helix-turn-helix transcriptional regulator [Coxiellaceae bacterium]